MRSSIPCLVCHNVTILYHFIIPSKKNLWPLVNSDLRGHVKNDSKLSIAIFLNIHDLWPARLDFAIKQNFLILVNFLVLYLSPFYKLSFWCLPFLLRFLVVLSKAIWKKNRERGWGAWKIPKYNGILSKKKFW